MGSVTIQMVVDTSLYNFTINIADVFLLGNQKVKIVAQSILDRSFEHIIIKMLLRKSLGNIL